jgi:hydrogenase nickel incorporation protein HypA/HybF
MHELSVAMSIIDVAAEEARRQDTSRIVAVHLKLGPLAGVAKKALISAFEIAREGSTLDGAELVIQDAPLVARCLACNADRKVVSVQELCCAACGTPCVEIVSGRELDVVALEIE